MKGSFAPCFVAWNVGRERQTEREREVSDENLMLTSSELTYEL